MQTPPERDIWSVSRLNREVRSILEGSLPLLWVEGEISNLARPSSGHLYFSLKDPAAQVRCAMFRNRNLHLRFRPENGMQVLIRARVSLYEGRGEFQLIAEHMEEAGHGALQRAFEELKAKLGREGLFARERKKPLPGLPRRIGVITSPTGAAVRDILHVLKRRFPAIPVLVYPVPVQGEGAAEHIADSLRLASRRGDCDVLILARGGGSLEDLWAFNEEVVARAIADCVIPVVSGIGHEIDFTIADFVADQRAPTPSAAAELVSPDGPAWQRGFQAHEERLRTQLGGILDEKRQRLEWLWKRLWAQHPGQRLRERSQRLDEWELRLNNALQNSVRHHRTRLAEMAARLHRHLPLYRLERLEANRIELSRRLHAALQSKLEAHGRHLAELSRTLDAVSPLATLGRGYAIARTEDGRVIRDAAQVETGDRIEVRLNKGRLGCRVEEMD
jgi:exodeoxyribonuclease VII large subunit